MLNGDLGAGKTSLSRGIIRYVEIYMYVYNGFITILLDECLIFARYKLGDPTAIITSPSYLLDNTYEYYEYDNNDSKIIHHMDLYRVPQGIYVYKRLY